VSSSKTARLRRRHAARRKEYKRLRKSGRVPQHTRAERRRAEVERQREREAERSWEAWRRRKAVPTFIAVGAASFIELASPPASRGHYVHPYIWAADAAWSGRPDLPHQPETDMTFYAQWDTMGTANASPEVGPANLAHLGWLGAARVVGAEYSR
jgi:hypothetical protein